jgi:hypothetical protein
MAKWIAPSLVCAFGVAIAFAGCSSSSSPGTSSGSSGTDGGGSSSGTSGSTSGSSGTSGSTSGSSGSSGTSGSSGDAGGDSGLLPLLAVCSADAQCQSDACFMGGQGSYCSLHCTQANTATVCVAPEFNGVCNGQGYCKKP